MHDPATVALTRPRDNVLQPGSAALPITGFERCTLVTWKHLHIWQTHRPFEKRPFCQALLQSAFTKGVAELTVVDLLATAFEVLFGTVAVARSASDIGLWLPQPHMATKRRSRPFAMRSNAAIESQTTSCLQDDSVSVRCPITPYVNPYRGVLATRNRRTIRGKAAID